ncbi:hypothetical protein IR141_08150 [Neisseria sp. 19428wB4_WF04]|nr:hypothetical protein [Neisseria sp. 19428wB4_WF04]
MPIGKTLHKAGFFIVLHLSESGSPPNSREPLQNTLSRLKGFYTVIYYTVIYAEAGMPDKNIEISIKQIPGN